MSSSDREPPRVTPRGRRIYTRLILVDAHDAPKVLVQRLKNGLVVFPGGAYEESDGDYIESTVRECGEEGSLTRGALRELRCDLLWRSVGFAFSWQRGVDVYHMVHAPDELYAGLERPRDPEIASSRWERLRAIASGEIESGRIPHNTQRAARIATKRLPELFQYRMYLSTLEEYTL